MKSASGATTVLYASDAMATDAGLTASQIAGLRASGFQIMVLFTMSVDTNGDFNFAGQKICSGGSYVGPANWGTHLNQCLGGQSSLSRIEMCISGWGDKSFANIKNLIATQGSSTTNILYRNLAALHAALPISAMNYDEEDFSNYHAPSAVTFGKMAGALGMQITLCPYTNPSYWQAVAAGLTNCDYCYLQTYDGGLGNDPANWANLINGSVNGTRGVTVMPLYWDNDRNATYQTNMLAWGREGCVGGGLYESCYSCNTGGGLAELPQYAYWIQSSMPSTHKTALPTTMVGPVSALGGGDVVIFSGVDGWLGTNYNVSSSQTLYTRFSMNFHNLNGESGGGGGYGGLHFFQDDTPKLLVGNNWNSLKWSVDAAAAGQFDLSPATSIVLNQWHTMVVRTDYSPGGNTTVKMWLDPDFSRTETNQPNAPVQKTMDATFNNIRLRCGNGTALAEFSNVVVAATSTGVGFAWNVPQFQNHVPAINATIAPATTPISVQILFGPYGIGTNHVSLNLDGNNVAPTFAVTSNSITVNYQPPFPFGPGSAHTVAVSLTDSNGTPYSTGWSFTVDPYPELPVAMPGPFAVAYSANGDDGITICATNTAGWIGTNYQSNSSRTLYTRFSLSFQNLNGETGSGNGYGGLHFFQDTTPQLIVGNAWVSLKWSLDAAGTQQDLSPAVPVVFNQWHTIVVRTDFVPGGNDNVKVWLDPNFSLMETIQPAAPLTFSRDESFNNIHLRCGVGTASATFSNIVIAATAPEVGFAAHPPPALMSIAQAGGSLNLSWTSTGILQQASTVTGPWTDVANQANPQVLAMTNPATFYRLRQ